MNASRLIVPRLVACLAACLVAAAAALPAAGESSVLLGVDVLQRDGFAPLVGKRVGLITNHTGLDSTGRPTADLLAEADQVELVRLFGPEHGIRGDLDQSQIADGVDGPTGLPVVSLYGPRRKPEPRHLEGLDVLVFDIQDIGCRFYTYISTMKLAMEAAAEAGLPFVVLDRPNPIDGVTIEGPMLDPGAESFVACYSLPLRHGMTIGEIAKLLVAEADNRIAKLDLTVVKVEGWRRDQTWDETGLVWTDPSPNMRRLSQALLYPGVGFLETTNVSVGRGTDTPFERFGAPWINPPEFAAALNAEPTPGVRFVPRYFTPASSKHAGEVCGGVDIMLTDAEALDAVAAGLAMARTLARLYPHDWDQTRLPRLLGSAAMCDAIGRAAPLAQLEQLAEAGLDGFRERRRKVLLYR